MHDTDGLPVGQANLAEPLRRCQYRVLFGDAQNMAEVADQSVHLVVSCSL